MSYKRNTGANRDALFAPSGGGSSGGPAHRANHSANRDALFGSAGGGGGGAGGRPSGATIRPAAAPSTASAPRTSSSVSSRSSTSRTTTAATAAPTSRSRTTRTTTSGPTLSGPAKMAKMKEAEEYRLKAKKAMTRGIFSSPDPIAAGNYYKRAADAYKACGENRLERLHRIASADCQMGQDAYATAATEFMRAAELAAVSDEPAEKREKEVYKVYTDASEAWRQANELGRAGDCLMRAALGLLLGSDEEMEVEGVEGGRKLMAMNKRALKAIEEAVEAHVPDLLNRYASYRQTGTSAYVDPDADPNDATVKGAAMDLARHNMVKTSYAHETVYKACFKLIKYGEYPSALYAAGAATALISADGFATISLSRAFAAETVLCLALGDVVAADKYFLEVHLQKDSYLSSRECKLSEDLIRAIKDMDGEALEEARDPNGSNWAALANLDPSLRGFVKNLRMSGRAGRGPGGGGSGAPSAAAKKKAPPLSRPPQPKAPPASAAPPAPSAPTKQADSMLEGAALQSSLDANFAELDELNIDDMGLGGDDDLGGFGEEPPAVDDAPAPTMPAAEPEEFDDDDIDLR